MFGNIRCERNVQNAATRTDDSVTNCDRTSEVSRGRSRWMQTGEGLKALQPELRFGVRKREQQINRTVVPSKARTVPDVESGKWSGK